MERKWADAQKSSTCMDQTSFLPLSAGVQAHAEADVQGPQPLTCSLVAETLEPCLLRIHRLCAAYVGHGCHVVSYNPRSSFVGHACSQYHGLDSYWPGGAGYAHVHASLQSQGGGA